MKRTKTTKKAVFPLESDLALAAQLEANAREAAKVKPSIKEKNHPMVVKVGNRRYKFRAPKFIIPGKGQFLAIDAVHDMELCKEILAMDGQGLLTEVY